MQTDAYGGSADAAGGSSGGGSVNIFYLSSLSSNKEITANGPVSGNGGKGGNGTVTIGSIETGTFEKYTE